MVARFFLPLPSRGTVWRLTRPSRGNKGGGRAGGLAGPLSREQSVGVWVQRWNRAICGELWRNYD